MIDQLEDLIVACIVAKEGDKEFALFYEPVGPGKPWTAMIGNESSNVRLGEIGGEVEAEGFTPVEAVAALLEQLPPGMRFARTRKEVRE